jgi:hypothetical protein
VDPQHFHVDTDPYFHVIMWILIQLFTFMLIWIQIPAHIKSNFTGESSQEEVRPGSSESCSCESSSVSLPVDSRQPDSCDSGPATDSQVHFLAFYQLNLS